MLNNQTLNDTTENSDFTAYYGLETLPKINTTAKQSRHFHKVIEDTVHDFDRRFDSTAVDTYAFNKVLTSDIVSNIIYYYLHESELEIIAGLKLCKEDIAGYILNEVQKMYQDNDHTIVEPDVYYYYIDKLLARILIQ